MGPDVTARPATARPLPRAVGRQRCQRTSASLARPRRSRLPGAFAQLRAAQRRPLCVTPVSLGVTLRSYSQRICESRESATRRDSATVEDWCSNLTGEL